MKITVYKNGEITVRDATPEEIAELEKQEQTPQIPTDSERIDALEQAIKEGLKL